jgi:hypothetical protein
MASGLLILWNWNEILIQWFWYCVYGSFQSRSPWSRRNCLVCCSIYALFRIVGDSPRVHNNRHCFQQCMRTKDWTNQANIDMNPSDSNRRKITIHKSLIQWSKPFSIFLLWSQLWVSIRTQRVVIVNHLAFIEFMLEVWTRICFSFYFNSRATLPGNQCWEG